VRHAGDGTAKHADRLAARMRRARLLLTLALVPAVVAVAFVAQKLTGTDDHGAHVETLTIDSRAVGERLRTTVVTPAAAAEGPRPLLVFLHGRSGDERSELDDAFFAALAALGRRAPIVAFPSGGDHSYWHDRADGRWGTYVTREVIPAVVSRFGADRRRVAIGGISMGGFGAYDIARLHPGRFCAVGGHSPALWRSGGETAPGAFDDADDFARHDVIGAARSDPAAFGAARLWVDAGDEDPFHPGVEALAAALDGRLTSRTWPGGHEAEYWNAHWASYARFYARALARCER
jgi:S-formylglutathione hydrolase FrmB